MPNYNKVTLIGHLTRDPEMRNTQSGLAVANFGMGMTNKWVKDGEKKEDTCFVDLTAFGTQAEVLVKYVGKGDPLFVEGRLKLETWEKDGQKRSKIVVIVEKFEFLKGKDKDADEKPKRQAPKNPATEDYGDAPF